MRYLIDTNVISELRKGARCHPSVAAFFGKVASDALFLSVLTVGELRKGIEQVRSRDRQQAESLSSWLDNVQNYYSQRILPVDVDVAIRWGQLNAIRTFPVIDGLLASTALVHGLTLVTRNGRDLEHSGVVWFDPFSTSLPVG